MKTLSVVICIPKGRGCKMKREKNIYQYIYIYIYIGIFLSLLAKEIMRLIIKLMFAVLLFLNSVSQIDGHPDLLPLPGDQNYDYLTVLKRQYVAKLFNEISTLSE